MKVRKVEALEGYAELLAALRLSSSHKSSMILGTVSLKAMVADGYTATVAVPACNILFENWHHYVILLLLLIM